MGVPERSWYRPDEPPPRRRYNSVALLATLSLLLVAVVGVKWMRFSEKEMSSHSRSAEIKFSILPGLPGVTIRKGSLYPENDAWKSYLASEQTCPGGERTDLPLSQQADIMVCLVNYARQQRGLSALSDVPLLNDTSLQKADKIVRCNEFAHDACGDDPVADVRAAGYYGPWGENLYLGEGRLGAPRVALDGWLNSPEHRDNLFRSNWQNQGIAAMTAPHVGAYSDVTIWVNQFAVD